MLAEHSVTWVTGAQINGRDRTVLRRRRSAVDKYNELPALHSITSFARSAREHRCRDGQRMGQQRPRSCDTAPGLGSILPRRTASQKGITCSTSGSRSPWRGQDDRLRRPSRTHRRVASIPPWPCTTRAERSNAGPSFRSAFERGQVHLDHGKPPWPEAMSESGVRRAKAALSSGCKPHPAIAPAGSNRSSHGGNEVAEAFD
jgi:hypothetical protein